MGSGSGEGVGGVVSLTAYRAFKISRLTVCSVKIYNVQLSTVEFGTYCKSPFVLQTQVLRPRVSLMVSAVRRMYL